MVSSRDSSQDVVRDVYRRHAVTFFDELRAWFTKETRSLRWEAEKQLEADQLKGLRERIEQLEGNAVFRMPTSSGDAAAGGGCGGVTSPRSISPNKRSGTELIGSLDPSALRSICRDEARRSVEEIRGELLGGDLFCDELLSGGAGLRPALARLLAESPIISEVAELRASVDGAVAEATAAASAEIGRLDGAFRSSLAAEVRDLGSLCEGVRFRIEALDQSAAAHIGRLSTRLEELEVRSTEAPAPRVLVRADSVQSGSSCCTQPRAERGAMGGEYAAGGEQHYYSDTCEAGAGHAMPRSRPPSNVPSPRAPSKEYPGQGLMPDPTIQAWGVAPTTSVPAADQANHSHCSVSERAFESIMSVPLEVHRGPPPSRLQSQAPATTPRSTPAPSPHSTPALGSCGREAAGVAVAPFQCAAPLPFIPALPTMSSPTVATEMIHGCGMGGGPGSVMGSPSTPPKRHLPPGNVGAALRVSPGGGRFEAGEQDRWAPPAAANASSRSSKGGQKATAWGVTPISPGRLEVRGGC